MPEALSGDVRINYDDQGDGEAVAFLPGLGMSHATWAAAARRLARTHRVLCVDPRGSGASDKPDAPLTPATVSADLAAVLDAAGVDGAHLVGQSMGGMIAQDFALEHPERVRTLTLVSTCAAADDWTSRMMAARRNLIETGGLALQFSVSLLLVFSPRAFREIGPFIAQLEERLATDPPDERAYLRQLDYCAGHDAAARLGRLAMPCLVVAGSHDVVTSAIQNRELAELIPGARYVEFDGASHGLIWEEPDRFGDVLAGFLAGAAASDPDPIPHPERGSRAS
jgi:pimeloyl-ACP methyl ester carboxylesterase